MITITYHHYRYHILLRCLFNKRLLSNNKVNKQSLASARSIDVLKQLVISTESVCRASRTFDMRLDQTVWQCKD